MSLEQTLRARRSEGNKLLVPYVTGGLDGWTDYALACEAAGADAIEIGIPFSDPVMDGPVIQEASVQALEGGATPTSILSELGRTDLSIPVVVMTYTNIAMHAGATRFAESLANAGVSGAILADLPLDEGGTWFDAAEQNDIETVLLAAPNSTDERLGQICAASRGFVYGVSLLGVTGERAELADSAHHIGGRLKAITDVPVLLGVGVSTPSQARAAAASADGVIVGSALVRRILDGAGTAGVENFVGELRRALDEN
jgi:tryptophan synthase alpha chain